MIELSLDGDVAVLRMAHGKANAQDVEFCEAMANAFAEQRNSAARAVVLTGSGSIFSAGVDLLRISAGGDAYVRRFLPALHRMFEAAFYLPKPVVAAVNGHAMAGGCVLACCADARIMARGNARMGITEILVGVPFPALAYEVMRYAANPQYLPDMTLTGATYLGDEARTRGLVDEVVEPSALMDRAMAVGEDARGHPRRHICRDQGAAAPAGDRPHGAAWRAHRCPRSADLGLARDAAKRPRLCRADVQERVERDEFRFSHAGAIFGVLPRAQCFSDFQKK